MRPEQRLWAWLKPALKPLGKRAHVWRIETETDSGYPDVEGCIDGRAFLCELKVAHYVRKRDLTFALPHFTTKQAYELTRRREAGGRSFLLVRVCERHYLLDGRSSYEVLERKDRLSEALLQGMAVCSPLATAGELWTAMSTA